MIQKERERERERKKEREGNEQRVSEQERDRERDGLTLQNCDVQNLASFYRTSAGAEIDLVLDMGPRHGIWGIEIKRSEAPTVGKGFYSALKDIKPDKAFIIYSGQERYPKTDTIEVISLTELIKDLQALN